MIIISVFMLILIVFLSVQNIYFLNKNNSTLSKIDEIYNRKIDIAMRMSKVVRERSLNIVTMYLSGDAWERDEIFIKFHKLKLAFLKLNNEMKVLGLLENEENIFQLIISMVNSQELVQIDIVEHIQSGE